MDQKIINWGVLGCASIAENRVIPGILESSNGKLYAISSRGNNEKLARFRQKFQPEAVYSDYDDLLNDPNVDAVYIPLPNGLHFDWVLRAAGKGKHILCEKPLGISKKQVIQMRDVCEMNGVHLMEAFAFRHSPLTVKAKSIVDSGILGEIQFIESHYGYNLKNEEDVRLSESLYGGATYDVGCYNINLIRYLAGSEPAKICAVGNLSDKHRVDIDSSILMDFRNGIQGFSFCSMMISKTCFYKVIGTEGILTVNDEYNSKGKTSIHISTENGCKEIEVDCPDNYMLEIEQFGRVIAGEEKPFVPIEDSIGNAAAIDEGLKQIIGR